MKFFFSILQDFFEKTNYMGTSFHEKKLLENKFLEKKNKSSNLSKKNFTWNGEREKEGGKARRKQYKVI